MTPTIDISVEAEGWSAVGDLDGLVERAVSAALLGESIAAPVELSVLFCDDAAIRALNRDWRSKDEATNVLSFPSAPAPHPSGGRMLGDIAVAFETTRREADEEGKALEAHLTHLIVHGVLHLIGYDHEADEEAEAMEARERQVLAGLGVADPYAGSEAARAVAR